jgi:hypothetical protein
VLVLVGGFLGAGKTTLLLEAAGRLRAAGHRVAMITNDQGGELVDTRLAEASGTDVQEIVGGCFCCRFSDLVTAIERLGAHDPEFILVEPVGSCIDILATVLQPLRQFYADRIRLAPFTVLVDPERARQLLAAGADPDLAYLFENQLAEADLVCFSKADLYSDVPDLPAGYALRLSSATGEGVSEWLGAIVAGNGVAGSRVLDVDYQKYADAEAALGWLNWQADVDIDEWLSPAQLLGPWIEDLDQRLSEAGIEIVHLKAFDQASTGYIKASLCRNGTEPSVLGDLAASPAERHRLLLNLRAPAAPEQLKSIVEAAAQRLPGRITRLHSESFRPAPPKPELRITSVT